MLLEQIQTDPTFFFSVVITVIISITLHELAHGWVAIWQGDATPIEQNRMVFNPVVHMGWLSLILLATAGIAYGMMPVDPSRFRSRYGDAMVAAAGPAMNLLLALIGLTGGAYWIHAAGFWDALPHHQAMMQQFVWVFGSTNLALLILNLLPIPPLDGARIVGNLVPPIGQAMRQMSRGQGFGIALVVVLVLLNKSDLGIGQLAGRLSMAYANLLFGTQLYFD
jgi:Zn-dependent protease